MLEFDGGSFRYRGFFGFQNAGARKYIPRFVPMVPTNCPPLHLVVEFDFPAPAGGRRASPPPGPRRPYRETRAGRSPRSPTLSRYPPRGQPLRVRLSKWDLPCPCRPHLCRSSLRRRAGSGKSPAPSGSPGHQASPQENQSRRPEPPASSP